MTVIHSVEKLTPHEGIIIKSEGEGSVIEEDKFLNEEVLED